MGGKETLDAELQREAGEKDGLESLKLKGNILFDHTSDISVK